MHCGVSGWATRRGVQYQLKVRDTVGDDTNFCDNWRSATVGIIASYATNDSTFVDSSALKLVSEA